jgi:transposase-like protein
MPRKQYTAEQIIEMLRQAEVELAQGATISMVCWKLGITDQTYYRWRKEYGGLRVDQAKRLRELEKENTRLKRIVTDQALDRAIMKAAVSGNF